MFFILNTHRMLFIAVIVILENIHLYLAVEVHREDLKSFDSPVNISKTDAPKIDDDVENRSEYKVFHFIHENEVTDKYSIEKGCITYKNGPECCDWLKLPTKPFVCVNITFKGENQTDLYYYFKSNSKILIEGEIINFEEETCLFDIGSFLELCFYFTHMSRENGTLSGCAHLKFRIIAPTVDINLGCFGGASSAFSLQPTILLLLLCAMIFND